MKKIGKYFLMFILLPFLPAYFTVKAFKKSKKLGFLALIPTIIFYICIYATDETKSELEETADTPKIEEKIEVKEKKEINQEEKKIDRDIKDVMEKLEVTEDKAREIHDLLISVGCDDNFRVELIPIAENDTGIKIRSFKTNNLIVVVLDDIVQAISVYDNNNKELRLYTKEEGILDSLDNYRFKKDDEKGIYMNLATEYTKAFLNVPNSAKFGWTPNISRDHDKVYYENKFTSQNLYGTKLEGYCKVVMQYQENDQYKQGECLYLQIDNKVLVNKL